MQATKKDCKRVKVVPICLPPSMISNMDRLAGERGTLKGRSTIARLAISAYLAQYVTCSQQEAELVYK